MMVVPSSTALSTTNYFITRQSQRMKLRCGSSSLLRSTIVRSSSLSSSSSTTASQPRVDISIDASIGCAHVKLNRPEKLNALDLPMFEAIAQAAVSLRTERGLRSVIISGQGRAFCTGLDVKSMVRSNPFKTTRRLLQRPSGYQQQSTSDEEMTQASTIKASDDHTSTEQVDGDADDDEINSQSNKSQDEASQQEPLPLPALGNLAQDVGYLWRSLPVPVIAVLHGMCYGGGLQIALGADMRYATPDCQLSIMETKWGLLPDMSASITLRELVRIDVAKELTMTGRVVLGPEAAELGLITKCVDDPWTHAQSMAKQIASRSPDAVAAAKHLYQTTFTAASQQECLELETKLQQQLLGSWNQAAASARNYGIQLPYRQHQPDEGSKQI